jgi:hypothetical protein
MLGPTKFVNCCDFSVPFGRHLDPFTDRRSWWAALGREGIARFEASYVKAGGASGEGADRQG